MTGSLRHGLALGHLDRQRGKYRPVVALGFHSSSEKFSYRFKDVATCQVNVAGLVGSVCYGNHTFKDEIVSHFHSPQV